MKITHYSILALSLMMSGNVLSAPTETTNDYAYGAELIIKDDESMFSRVNLNSDIYTQTVSTQLDDVRVFNRNGQTVPFTLAVIYDKTQSKQQFDMVLYPMNQNEAKVDNSSGKQNYSVTIQGQNINVSMNQPSNNKGKYVITYLLKVPSNNQITVPITDLKLQFADQQENWQATADISYSSDFRYWRSATNNVPLMALKNNDNQTLSLNDIKVQYANADDKNWLITLYSQTPIPELKKVIASSENSSIKKSLHPIDFALESSDTQTAIYSLKSAQPVNLMSIDLSNSRTVLPVKIYYKSNSNDDKWIKFDEKIIRKTDKHDTPTQISFNDRLVHQIKLETINSSFEKAPNLIAYRNKVDLIFNSANNAPFILAWGSNSAKAAALSESTLLTDKDSVSSLPEALIGPSVKLAGESALKAATQSPSSSGFPRWIIILGLVVGAGVLVLLAVKLAKEVKNQ